MPSSIRSPSCGVLSSSGWTLPLSACRTMLSTSTSTCRGIEMDREPACDKPAISRFLEHGTQFANDLAQRGARFFLVRSAPQQADKPFAALVFGLGQGEIAEDGAGLLGSKLDRPAFESYRQASNQRDRKGARRLRARSPTANSCNVSGLPHPKKFRSGSQSGIDYTKATPPV